MAFGYNGKILHVDLTRSTTSVEEPPEIFYRNLARYGGEKTGFFPVSVSPPETLGSLVQKFRIPREEISMVLVNNQFTRDFEILLHPGDKVKIFGLVGGG